MTIETPLYHPDHFDRERPVGTYWATTVAGEPAAPPLAADVAAEVAVIGGGFTGLSAALHLAREHGIAAVVLEAGPIGWGASGRNGGFCALGGTKRGYAGLAARHGVGEARRLFDLQRASQQLVRAIAAEEGFDLGVAGEGEHIVAHRPGRWQVLEQQSAAVARLFGERWPLWRPAEMAERLFRSPEAHGCLVIPHAFGLNPLRLVHGLAAAAARRGARVCARTPVTAWEPAGARHRLVTPGGTVTAARVLVATNGYTPEGLAPALAGRTLPALSSILVTRPLTAGELAAQGWRAPALVADTRRLLTYIRLLGDNRLLFGARGGLDAAPVAMAARRAWLRARLAAWFPAWRDVEVDHAWWGLVCLARDLLPHLGWLDEGRSVLAALAYHGGGVGMATAFGRAAASLLAGRAPDPPLPAFVRTSPPRFPAPRLRLAGLRAAYAGYGLRDALP